ncbi:unnamed protein product [Spodoptera littoralis]|uniref:Uncharacterized protein n=1 Tax=Spodoptera littoralis TaxID=7109 RepID=A0A9P0IFN8_SPOLI|nr:unnamed protein product [Spodoptera littoralis]CAH1645992.1 unnamed protein product [Spodoptera littoralis]
MGNVQCCASGRFPVGKPPKKAKNKKKTKGLKGVSKKNSSVSSGKGNGAVQKVATMAEDGSEKAAPAETLVQAAPTAVDVPDGLLPRQEENEMQQANDSRSGSSSPRTESMAAARERFFGQVLIDIS